VSANEDFMVQGLGVDAADFPTEPLDLWRNVLAARPTPTSALPSSIAVAAYAAPDLYPPNVLARCMLNVVHAAVSANLRVRVSSTWYEGTGDWLALVGPPGATKSPSMNLATDPLHSAQVRLNIQYRNARAAWEKLPREERGPEPAQRILMTGDATLAALGKALAENPHGVLLQHSELSALIAQMDNPNASRGASERGDWLALADAIRAHTTLRIGRGVVDVRNWTASVLGAMTTEKIEELVRNLIADGLLARFGVVEVPELPISDKLEPDDPDALRKYTEVVERLVAWHDKLEERTDIRLSPGAVTLFAAQRKAWLEDRRIYQMTMPRLSERIAKYPGLLARMALALHTYKAAEADNWGEIVTKQISESTMHDACAIMLAQADADRQFYVGLDGAAATPGHALAQRIADWLLEHGTEQFGLADLTRGPRAWREAAQDVATQALALEVLEQCGWIQWPKETPLWSGKGLSRGLKFTVNPAAHARFAGRADRVREMALELRERMKPEFAQRRCKHLSDRGGHGG
jgi:hypothetical protein